MTMAMTKAGWGWMAFWGCVLAYCPSPLFFDPSAAQHKCVFDRNEIGPKGADGGQWWFDVYKCPDGTERRVLVAGPRG